MNLKDLISHEIKSFSDEQGGFRKYNKARFIYTKEKAEEFSRVTVEQIIDDPYFLNYRWSGERGMYPALKEVLIQLEEERKKRIIKTFLFTGSVGGGKSTLAACLTYIEVFYTIILPDPCAYYNLTPGSDICFITLSRDADKAKKVTFKKILPVFARSPFFQDYFPAQIDMEKLGDNPRFLPGDLRFPKNIIIFPGTGHAASILGHNARSGIIDEANDLEVIEKSKKAVIKTTYDAAQEAFTELINRVDSRFPFESLFRQGKRLGIVCLIGQTRGPDSFLEKKIRESEILGKNSTTFWIRKARWESQPRDRFLAEEFIVDVTNGRVVDFISISDRKDIVDCQCSMCNILLKEGGYVGNNSKLVCSLECYEESFYGKTEAYKEKSCSL
jgi:hypothetical protein